MRHSGGFSLGVFTPDELQEIHLATLEVLEKTGVFVESEEALEVLDGGGAWVDPKTKMVRFPPYLVEDAIRSAPSKFVAAGRIPESDVVLESNRVSFTNFGEGIMITDPYTGEHRETRKADLANAAVLIDYLDNIDVYERSMLSHDVPHRTSPLHNAEASLLNTTKHHFLCPGDGFLARKVVDMLAAIVGGKQRLRERPLLSFLTCPVSPLKLVRDCCEIIMEGARAGIAVNILSMAMAGGSAPVNLAGTLVTHNAEVLSGITLNQLVRKGSPVVYGSSTCGLDLLYTTASVGSPELAMISAAVATMARYYLLPSFVAGG
ncbi:MAG: trimethylamine methyltransferase family protein [Spirochaetales bacterium]|nr:trimethylamine methyltransferase family protein [Spirochaetales bacterium]